ncbi:MAG TPA: Lrp/AsnC family transcriptional regulator [Candidatus Limnocylindria bacterium]|nr:Lrp/AsnC family transcriptional regulator [Candidatus Limnocylindria bacterium]
MNTVVPVETTDPINSQILAVSEDRIQGFHRDPFLEISRLAELPLETVLSRLGGMLEACVIRRVRQTLLATSLADGALCAWQVPIDRTDAGFDYLFKEDPFSGHVVVRSTDAATPGSNYRLWTTLKVPQGYSLQKHAQYLAKRIGAETYRLMPARKLFALGVGHVRRRGMEPGSRADVLAEAMDVQVVQLTELEWRVLTALKREFSPDEICAEPWKKRAAEADLPLEVFCEIATDLDLRKVIGRFSTFLEHVKTLSTGERVTRFNALFHWAVPAGREIDAGREVGRHHIMTHAYWREGGPEFRNVNVMGVAHGTDKEMVLAHKAAIDKHLEEAGISVSYTNVFWGGRSEIKPSEISPFAYRDWAKSVGLDPETMRE